MAKSVAKSVAKFWESMTDEEIVSFQLFEKVLCMPWGVFHGAVEKCLDRSVWTHEFAYSRNLQREFEKKKAPPYFDLEGKDDVG